MRLIPKKIYTTDDKILYMYFRKRCLENYCTSIMSQGINSFSISTDKQDWTDFYFLENMTNFNTVEYKLQSIKNYIRDNNAVHMQIIREYGYSDMLGMSAIKYSLYQAVHKLIYNYMIREIGL